MNVARGDLAERIRRNVERLVADEYRYPGIFQRVDDWPGDWVGRTLLALCEQYEATNRGDAALFLRIREIVEGLPRYLNENFYFGALFNGETVDEQQLSGNSWYLRALCDYYRITGDGGIYAMLQTIADNFLKALAPFYERYPRIRKQTEGGVSGRLAESSVEGWRLSSDVGCAFILLDGITDLYGVLRDDAVLLLAKTVAGKFLSFDPCELCFQTHATLSATRGIVRLARFTGEKRYLDEAERIFALYEEKGCTVNYANFNWFRRPDSWTEPCAFLDSLILACELFSLTGRNTYAQFANRVYFNAVRTAQRKNGGAGCETCLCAENAVLRVHMYEAFFCCTMRLGNGLNYVREKLFCENGGVLQVNFALSGRYESETLALEYSILAERGEVVINVERGAVRALRLYLPAGVRIVGGNVRHEDCFAVICGLDAGEHVFPLEISVLEEVRGGRRVYFRCDYLLTEKGYPEEETFFLTVGGKKLSPIGDCMAAEERYGIDNFIQSV